ncbi:transposase [Microvirga sp. BT688]|uniref:IS66 family transposase n=1 Tax=Microvirga sp. TaxID=1873136 RepID=UPI0016854C2E|nr:transposase [Microvirga sp.]
MGKVGFELEPLVEYALARIKQSEGIFADETALSTLALGAGKAKTAYLWAYVRADRSLGGSDSPNVVYRFEDRQSG